MRKSQIAFYYVLNSQRIMIILYVGNRFQILEQMGIGNMFKGNVDLSALTGNANDVTVDDVVHKAKISIDEEGTIAAAATAFIMSRSSRPVEPFKFRCNHPFIYFIFDKVTGSVLFMGVYNSPKSNQISYHILVCRQTCSAL